MTEHRNDETMGTGRTDMPEGHGDKPSSPEDASWQRKPDATQPGGGQGGQGGQGQTYGQGGQGGQGQTYGQGGQGDQGHEGLGRENQGLTWRGDEESDEGEKSREEQGTGTPR